MLAGAEFEILDKDKKVIDTFKTDNEWYNPSNLVAGETYTLRELKAPIGYTLMRDLMFKVDEAMPGEVLTAINKLYMCC